MTANRECEGEVLVTVSGLTGSGKSAIAGEIEILCKALGLEVQWVNGEEEKRMTHADWTEALELYKPRVRIVEQNVSRVAAAPQERDAGDEAAHLRSALANVVNWYAKNDGNREVTQPEICDALNALKAHPAALATPQIVPKEPAQKENDRRADHSSEIEDHDAWAERDWSNE